MIFLIDEFIILGSIFLVAFLNGANDIANSIATLVGSGVTKYKKAVFWGSIFSLIGAISAFFAAKGLLKIYTSSILTESAVTSDFARGVPRLLKKNHRFHRPPQDG